MARGDAEHISELYRSFFEVVRRIPPGRVATYGQVAELAGHPGAARAVGAALRASPRSLGLPWQRVVGKKARNAGQVVIHDPVGGAVQRQLLEAEGVEFTAAGSIRLDRFGWLPGEGTRRGARPKTKTARPGGARRRR